MRKPIVSYVADFAAAVPGKIAVIVNDKETSYKELYDLVCGYCNYLRAAGIKKGDIVVTRAKQQLDYAVLYLAIHLSGAIVASLEAKQPIENVVKIAKKLQAAVIIEDHKPMQGIDFPVLDRGDILQLAQEHFTDSSDFTFPSANDLADVLFTTGTTGESKGVTLSHNALTATAENLISGCEYKQDTVMIVPGPLNHANAIRKLFTSLANGSTIYILNGMLNLKRFYDALEYPKGHIACCLPPSAIRTLFQNTGDKIGEYADRIDFIETATAPLPEVDKQRLCQLLPKTRLYNNYGSSESASVCMYDYNRYPGLIGCVGKPAKNSEILVVDDNKKAMKSSKSNTGLIACKSDTNMEGYIHEPEITADVLIGGIVYTNDIGYIDENGFVYVTGRKGDVINVGGLKVAPTEVEAAALEFDGVEDCICIGVDNPVIGKALKLLVVIRKDSLLQGSALRKFLLTKLEQYKVPTYYEQVTEITKTFNGKIDRKAYR